MKEGAFELGPGRLGRISPGGRNCPVSVQSSPSQGRAGKAPCVKVKSFSLALDSVGIDGKQIACLGSCGQQTTTEGFHVGDDTRRTGQIAGPGRAESSSDLSLQ